MGLRKIYLAISLLTIATLSGTLTSPQSPSTNKLGIGRKYSTIERMNLERLRAVNADKLKIQNQRKAVTLQTGLAITKPSCTRTPKIPRTPEELVQNSWRRLSALA